mmetsp:Transcript_2444/g.6564  ORF Transcript_2444/g.6564 Transcript_2444/m.6564 type:complete len:204 (-) Transcript_2444:110-721(-)
MRVVASRPVGIDVQRKPNEARSRDCVRRDIHWDIRRFRRRDRPYHEESLVLGDAQASSLFAVLTGGRTAHLVPSLVGGMIFFVLVKWGLAIGGWRLHLVGTRNCSRREAAVRLVVVVICTVFVLCKFVRWGAVATICHAVFFVGWDFLVVLRNIMVTIEHEAVQAVLVFETIVVADDFVLKGNVSDVPTGRPTPGRRARGGFL